MILLEGKKVAREILHALQREVASLSSTPQLAVILIGNPSASLVYVEHKKRVAEQLGISFLLRHFPKSVSQNEIEHCIREQNADPATHGILLQAPLPPSLSFPHLIELIDPQKDVDGLHPLNLGSLLMGTPRFIPCTPLGIFWLLQRYGLTIEGKRVVIVGRSHLVGKPLAALLLLKRVHANATVTVAHGKTDELSSLCRKADILIAAAGSPLFIGPKEVKRGAILIDVGINRLSLEGKERLVGDIAFDQVSSLCHAITPVPGGVGPMTVALLFHNLLQCVKKRYHSLLSFPY